MKTRNGFVSNSSSSSFLIYGVRANFNHVEDPLIKEEISDSDDKYAIAEIVCQNTKLGYWNYYDEFYIGRSWDDIGYNETGGQFQESVQNEIDRIFGEGIKCSTYEEAWYNG